MTGTRGKDDTAAKASRRSTEEAGEDGGPPRSLAARVWEQVGPLLLAVLIALGIRAMVIESYYVPSESMLPTLLIGDHVFVNKFVYGAKIPFTDVHLPALRDRSEDIPGLVEAYIQEHAVEHGRLLEIPAESVYVLRDLGLLPQAEREFQVAIDLEPRYPPAHAGIGRRIFDVGV